LKKTAIAALAAALLSSPAHAWHRHYLAHYSGDCAKAAAQGGPCGCEAMKIVHLTDTKFWLVRNWLSTFPRTEARVGAAAVWHNVSHVEIVSALNSDGTVDTRGSVGWHHVPRSRLTFVDPHPGRRI
jgi:hypothetical protein